MEIKDYSEEQKQEVYRLLEEADNDFVPPISQSSGTFGDDFGSSGGYFAEMLKEKIVVADVAGEIVGFIAFIPNHRLEGVGDCLYLTTGVVRRDFRGRGVGKKIAEYIISKETWNAVCTRTWSTNEKSQRVLRSLGFEIFNVIKDHRGTGIDTYYYKLTGFRGS